MKRESAGQPVQDRFGTEFQPDGAASESSIGNGDHPLVPSQIETMTVVCERCGNRFYPLLTDGRCTTCNSRNGQPRQRGDVPSRLMQLTRTRRGLGLSLFGVAVVVMILIAAVNNA